MSDVDDLLLIVDDDVEFCSALRAALRRRGLRSIVAHRCEEALEEARAWSPGRAVVDLRMPGRDGLTVVSELRAICPEIRIVVLTGFGSIATAVSAMERGAVNYLTKPAAVDDILDAFDGPGTDVPIGDSRAPTIDEVEWEYLQRVLTTAQGNVSEAARLMNMHRRTLQRKLQRGPPHPGKR